MSGEAYDYIVKKCKQRTRDAINALYHMATPSNKNVDVITFTNQELTRGRLSNGQEVDVVPVGAPNPIRDTGYKITEGKYLVYREALKVIHLEGSLSRQFIITSASPDDNGVLSLPEFNLVNVVNWTAYRIPKESLTTLYDTSLDGTNGWWTCSISPNKAYITIVRLAQTTVFTSVSNFPYGTIQTATASVRVYCSVISNFTLNAVSQLVDLTSATITNKVTNYTYDGEAIDPTSLPPASGVGWTESADASFISLDPPLAVLPDTVNCAATTTWTFLGFFHNQNYDYQLVPMAVIGYTSGNVPIVDLVGRWQALGDAIAVWLRSDGAIVRTAVQCIAGIGESITNVTSRLRNIGGWTVTDFMGTATHTIGSGSVSPLANPNFPKVVPPNHSTIAMQTGDVFFNLTYRSGNNTANGASNVVRDTYYYQAPYNSTVDSFASSVSYFGIDSVRKYDNFNSVTSWVTDTALVKLIDSGVFLDVRTVPAINLRSTSPSGVLQFKKWVYNNVDVSQSLSKTTSTVPVGFGVITESNGTLTNYRILDWQL